MDSKEVRHLLFGQAAISSVKEEQLAEIAGRAVGAVAEKRDDSGIHSYLWFLPVLPVPEGRTTDAENLGCLSLC
jgi:hypothetical protein